MIGFGYIRLSCNDFQHNFNIWMNFPPEIIVMIIHYFRCIFEWDSETSAKDIIISDDKQSITCNVDSNRFFSAKNLLSSDEFGLVDWEITIKQIDCDEHLCLAIGYVECDKDSKSIERNQATFLGGYKTEYSIYIDAFTSENPFSRYNNGEETERYDTFISNNVKVNDTLTIQFDFDKKQCRFYYNKQFVAILSDELADKVYPAMACCFKSQFECTKWELYYHAKK